MTIKELIPWRIRNFFDNLIEQQLRPKSHKLYKLIKFGRTNINTREYWNSEWASDNQQRDYDQLFALIMERIPEGAKVLDVGCGVGRLSKQIKARRNADVTCLDFSDWACEQLKKEGFKTVVSELPAIPLPDDTFDIAVATEVFEHLDHPEKTIKQMARVVKPGGIVMCSVPNDALHPHVELEHQQAYTVEKVTALLSKYGTDVTTRTGELYPGAQVEFILGIVRLPV